MECTVCGWQGELFLPMIGVNYRRENAICPQCVALERHRGLVYFLQRMFILKGQRVLDFAPIEQFRTFFEANGCSYTSCDIDRSDVDMNFDICAMPMPDNSYDLVVCYHILEHVQDDAAAIKELHRILSPGGVCLVQVGGTGFSQPETVEFPAANPDDHMHWRRYGTDITSRIEAAGFSVTRIDFGEVFSRAEGEKHGFAKNCFPTFVCKRTFSVAS